MKKKNISVKKNRKPLSWVPAGTIVADPDAPQALLNVLAFGPDSLLEKPAESLAWVEQQLGKYPVLWLNVDRADNPQVLAEVGRIFKIHPVALEGVRHPHQRPKVENYGDFVFIAMRMLARREASIEIEQLSLFLCRNAVITFQEGIPGDCLESVRERLRKGDRSLRDAGADFLAYGLLDAVIDSYFPLLEDLGEQLEELESEVLLRTARKLGGCVHTIKRDLLCVRRAVWPLRDAINMLQREATTCVSKETQVFLRDSYDHCVQLIDLVETYRELGSSLMDVYLSSVSNRMNEVMTVLTIITTIFVPLTFVAGVYGMNFNTGVSPWNMPELNSRFGYPMALIGMGLVAALELGFFWSRGWLRLPDNEV